MKGTTRNGLVLVSVFTPAAAALAIAVALAGQAGGAEPSAGGTGQKASQPENRTPPAGPDILKQEPTNTSEPRPNAGGKPLPDRAEVARKQRAYLESRFDLSGRTDPNVKMSGGRKP